MALFRQILYPVDFSPRCLSVSPFVAAMAQNLQVPITLLHSIPIPPVWFGGAEGAYPPFVDFALLQRDAEARLAQLRFEPPFDDRNVDYVVNVGDPALAVTDWANDTQDTLVMLPTHGYGKFRNLLLGSVAAKVLHDSRAAVWTDTHEAMPKIRASRECKRVLCCVALNQHDEELIRNSIELAGGPEHVRLVHAVPVEGFPQKYFSREFDRFLTDSAKDRIADLQHTMGIELETCVRSGPIASIVHQTALLYGSDVLVVGRGVVRSPSGRLCTNAHAIIREAPCPVVSF